MIAENLSKSYQVADKKPGLMGTFQHLLARKFRTIDAVKGISFKIEPGEIVGFLGPNGAGKTTAIKVLTGLVQPSAGNVQVVGHTPFNRQPSFLKQITLVMGQKQQLIWDLPAEDSLRINAAVYDISKADYCARIDELKDMLQLDRQLTQPVRKLSLGERMKVELMAALLHRPKVLFLDEPTLGLDINAQAAVRQFLKQYRLRHGATILLTSHYMADVTALCDRVMLIHEGKLFYDGSLDQLMTRFAPYREVKLELQHPIERARLEAYGEVESVTGQLAHLLIRRENMTHTMERLLAELPLLDVTVSDPPVEQIIGKLFQSGNSETPA